MGQGFLPDIDAARDAEKCQAGIAAAGLAFTRNLLAGLQRCSNAAAQCVQTKPGDTDCLGRAGSLCVKELAKIGQTRPFPLGESDKLFEAITKACAPDVPVSTELVHGLRGLAYLGEDASCTELTEGDGVVDTVPEVQACVALHHACLVQTLLGLQSPRARELIGEALATQAGQGGLQAPCLTTNPEGEHLADPKGRGKKAFLCQKGISKAGAKFAANKLKDLHKCVNAVYVCKQTKAGEIEACLGKAGELCREKVRKLGSVEGPTGEAAKFATKLARICAPPAVALADLQSPDGLGFGQAGDECAEFGGPANLGSFTDVVTCLLRSHECIVERYIGKEVPRAVELFRAAGINVPARFPCLSRCGNQVVDNGEDCDGGADDLCPGQCAGDCTCSATTAAPTTTPTLAATPALTPTPTSTPTPLLP